MTFKIVSADERLARPRRVKACIFGPSGVGKTSLLRTLHSTSALLVDLEAGDLAVADWAGDSIPVRTWQEMLDLACLIGGPDHSKPDHEPFSAGHFAHVESVLGNREELLGKYELIFVDSVTVLSRMAMAWAERHPENNVMKGEKVVRDTRGAYGMMGREVLKLLTHLQHTPDKHVVLVGILEPKTDDFNRVTWEPQMEGSKIARELPGIVDLVLTMTKEAGPEGAEMRVFHTAQGNAKGYPAKDRSGKLAPVEPANLQAILDKIAARA
jgi:hypothetical protein